MGRAGIEPATLRFRPLSPWAAADRRRKGLGAGDCGSSEREAGVRRRGTDPSHIWPSSRGFHTFHGAGANSRGSIFTKLPPLFPRLHPQTYIALEDAQDGEKKDLQCRLTVLESHTRQLELKTKNYAYQSESTATGFRLNHRYTSKSQAFTHTHTHTDLVSSLDRLPILWPYVCLLMT